MRLSTFPREYNEMLQLKRELADAEETAQEFYNQMKFLKLKIEVSFQASR